MVRNNALVNCDAIALDFVIDDGIFMGNLGLLYTDLPGDPTFEFYVTKGFDEGHVRFFLRRTICDSASVDEIIADITRLIQQALSIYHQWDEKTIRTDGIFFKMDAFQ